MRPRWTGKHGRDVLEQLEPAVERPGDNRVEGDVGIAVVDPVAPSAPGDHWEHDYAEAVHQARADERPAQGEAADGAHRGGAVPLHRRHGLDGIAADELA